ncbi:MAG: DUF4956 domain-containing protein [Chitinophagales bacterium]|nr:DUF4956 domain-containing protein [Chitinophagales bacterium]
MFDYLVLQNYSENPTVLTIFITVLVAFFLASLIVITYDYTTEGVKKSSNFMQSMLLIAIVSATVMQAIGDSLARGLGMLGALAIIRFRTRLNNPRHITFMFASIATGIACGVYGFEIAFVGTIGFCFVAIVLKFTPLSKPDELVGTLRFEGDRNSSIRSNAESIIKQYCKKYKMDQFRFVNESTTDEEPAQPFRNILEFTYSLRLKDKTSVVQFMNEIQNINNIQNVRLRFNNSEDIL